MRTNIQAKKAWLRSSSEPNKKMKASKHNQDMTLTYLETQEYLDLSCWIQDLMKNPNLQFKPYFSLMQFRLSFFFFFFFFDFNFK
jgi:hypothetical protein